MMKLKKVTVIQEDWYMRRFEPRWHLVLDYGGMSQFTGKRRYESPEAAHKARKRVEKSLKRKGEE